MLSTASFSSNEPLFAVMLLTRGTLVGGQKFWAYVCIKPNMAKAFKEARDRGNFTLEEYGTVLEWGEGENPPADIAKRMDRDFGVRDDSEKQLLQAIAQLHD